MGSPLKTREIHSDEMSGLTEAPATGVRVVWDSVGRTEWDAFCASSSFAAYQQSYAYGEALIKLSTRLHRAQLYNGSRWIGAAQIQLKKMFGLFTVALVMRGPVWAAGDIETSTKTAAIDALHKTLPVSDLYGMIVTPEGSDEDIGDRGSDGGLQTAGYKRIMGGYHTVMLDLTPDEDALRAALNGKWRNRLKAAEKADIVISPFGKKPEKYAWLIAKEEAQQKTSGYQALPSAIVRHYHESTGKGGVVGFAAQKGADRLGGMLFLRHGDDATYHIGWASEAGKEANVHNLLLWRAIKGLKKAGVKTLDLGGVNTDFNPGIARFKIGTGGKVLSLSGSWSKGPRWRTN